MVNTHLHFDHAGNNDLLGAATFFVQREQYELAKNNPSYPQPVLEPAEPRATSCSTAQARCSPASR